MQDDPTGAEVIELAVQQALFAARTTTVGRVVAFRERGPNKAPVVDVQVGPQVPRRADNEADDQAFTIPVLTNVPVAFLQAGDFTVSTHLRPGQFVVVSVADRELDSWLEGDGQPYRPARPGFSHDLNDAIAWPFLAPEQYVPQARGSVTQLYIGDRTGEKAKIVLDSAQASVSIECAGKAEITATTAQVSAAQVTLGPDTAAPTAPIARVGVDVVVVPPGGSFPGATVPITSLSGSSVHQVKG